MNNLLILGSGRSGTSMVTGILGKNEKLYFGENPDYLGKNLANPKGFFEDYEVNTINEDILNKTIPFTFPERVRKKVFPSFTFYRARWLAVIPTSLKIRASKAIHKRIEKVLCKSKNYCFKDPRFSYTLPIWLPFLKEETKFVVVFREPYKTAESINRECMENKALANLKMTIPQALSIWYHMYSHIIKNYEKSNSKENWIFVHYEELFDNEVISRIENFLGFSIDKDFVNRAFNRTKEVKFEVPRRNQKLYEKLINYSSLK